MTLDKVFHALAHTGRRDMLRRLAESDLTVSELAEPLAMSLAAASKHVQVLERAGLLRRTVAGRRHVCSLEPRHSPPRRSGCASRTRSRSLPSRRSSARGTAGKQRTK